MDPRDGLIGHCLLHGPSCTAGAVLLEGVHLIDPEDGQEVLFSLCRFVPIGGDLPEEITRQLDVTPTHTPELVPA